MWWLDISWGQVTVPRVGWRGARTVKTSCRLVVARVIHTSLRHIQAHWRCQPLYCTSTDLNWNNWLVTAIKIQRLFCCEMGVDIWKRHNMRLNGKWCWGSSSDRRLKIVQRFWIACQLNRPFLWGENLCLQWQVLWSQSCGTAKSAHGTLVLAHQHWATVCLIFKWGSPQIRKHMTNGNSSPWIKRLTKRGRGDFQSLILFLVF